jgi:hypothetical protein
MLRALLNKLRGAAAAPRGEIDVLELRELERLFREAGLSRKDARTATSVTKRYAIDRGGDEPA